MRATPDPDLYECDQFLIKPVKKPAECNPWFLPGFNHPNTVLSEEINQQPYVVNYAAEAKWNHRAQSETNTGELFLKREVKMFKQRKTKSTCLNSSANEG